MVNHTHMLCIFCQIKNIEQRIDSSPHLTTILPDTQVLVSDSGLEAARPLAQDLLPSPGAAPVQPPRIESQTRPLLRLLLASHPVTAMGLVP